MPELLFTIGPPRSGKSTYCTEWAKAAPNRAIVCGDSIRQALGFEYRQETETLVQGIKDTMIRALLDRGQNVIVDGTHSTVPSIKRIFEIDSEAKPLWFPNFDFYYLAENFPSGKEYGEIINRGIETKGHKIVPVIQRIMINITELADRFGDEKLNELRK